jgi:signal transduction histidine kinase/putative methionine-R-sulfoxide reductase with GAF domain
MREVLEVISRSPNQLQPVLETIVQTAQRLCEADRAQFFTLEQDKYHLKAHVGTDPEFLSYLSENPIPADSGSGSTTVKAARERRTIHVPDTLADAEFSTGDLNRAGRGRSALAVPLLRGDLPIGVITVARDTIKPFTPAQIALIETFADQAVIAIENTRLFEAEQASKRELRESLDYQTATSEVLAAISRSPTNVQPVFDTIASSAAKLCDALDAIVLRVDRDMLRLVAHHGYMPTDDVPIHHGTLSGRTVIERRLIHVTDLQAEEVEFPEGSAFARRFGHRTTLSIPLLCEGEAIGNIQIRRAEVRPFTAKQIALVQTFADQAVIAIENSRLFEAEQASKRELARSVEELESLGKVSQAVNSSLELDKVLPTILEHACAMSYAGGGTVFEFDKTTSEFRLAAAHNMSDEHIAMVRTQPMHLNSVVVGECATRREVVQVADLSSAVPSPLLDVLLRTGVRAVLAVPLLHQAEVVGVLVVRRNQPGIFSPEIIRLVEAFAAQSAIAVENARLFGEIAHKSRELEIASQHKSQFVANMSHELRTPLAAILGYAELMQEGFYEPLGQKSLDALTRIRSNGKHLLGLINTVLDIAKIESGQFTLNMAEYAIESVVETVRSATESLAQNKKLALKTDVAKSLPIGLGDEQRLTQVLLNLVGNAIKFTDTGEVRIAATAVDGHFNVTVTDTGPGIPTEHQARIFDQFHQVDSSNTKAKGGTGLGLAIAKQIVEMHGGRIWVESNLGKGSTFQMELPTHAELRKPAS